MKNCIKNILANTKHSSNSINTRSTIMKNKEVYLYRISTWFVGLIIFFLASCSQTSVAPIPPTEPVPAEDPVFSTLDFATPQGDFGHGLAVNDNDLYVVGDTGGDLDGTNQGSIDGILRRYNGGKLWGLQFGTRSSDKALKVATDSNGDIYVVGETLGPLGFQVGGIDTFLAKFNKDGERLWIRQFGAKGYDHCIDLVVDSNNRIYVLSNEFGSNFVIRKFHPEGTLLRTRFVTTSSRPNLLPRAMAVDNLNNLIILTEWDNYSNGRGRDIRLFKYNNNLRPVWQKGHSTTNNEYPHDITTDSNNNIYFSFNVDGPVHFIKMNAAGTTLYSEYLGYSHSSDIHGVPYGSITSDNDDNVYIAGSTIDSLPTFTNAGSHDIVVFKYDSGGTQQWISQFDTNNYGSRDAEGVYDIAVSDVVYITGYTGGNLLTGSATSYGFTDAYVAQLDKADGTILGVDQ